MKKIICAVVAVMMLFGAAAAEGVTTEMWEHEAGWEAFLLAVSRDELNEAWEASIATFGEQIGLANVPVDMLKKMLLQGYSMESGVDGLKVEGNRFTGSDAEGNEVFAHEYAWADTMEDPDILGGQKVHVFRTEEADAGAYAWLLMTEPMKTEGENAEYTTFNLYCTGMKDYRQLFNQGGSVAIPCTMIEKDTGTDGLRYAIEKLFSGTIIR